MHFQSPGLREVLPTQIALKGNCVIAVQSLMSPQVRKLLEDPPADVALDRVRVPMIMFMLGKLQTVFELQIAELAIRFLDRERMIVENVFGQEAESAEHVGAEATLAFQADVRSGAQ